MLVEPICHVNGSGRNGNEAVAGVASEAFARWIRHRLACATVDLPSAGHIVSPEICPLPSVDLNPHL